jgi:hypothetical protein
VAFTVYATGVTTALFGTTVPPPATTRSVGLVCGGRGGDGSLASAEFSASRCLPLLAILSVNFVSWDCPAAACDAVSAGQRGGGQVQLGELAHQPPVGLLGERRLQISGAQPRLQMDDGYVPPERRQGAGQRRRRVALYHHRGRVVLAEQGVELADHLRQQLGLGTGDPLDAE